MSLFTWLWTALRQASSDDIDDMAEIPMARGTAAGVERLCGDKRKSLMRNRALTMLRVESISDVLREEWPEHGPRIAYPLRLQRATVCVQLCQWKRGACKAQCDNLKIAKASVDE